MSYTTYQVLDGERPDQVSQKFYGSPEFVWVLMLANGLNFGTWAMSEDTLQRHCITTYGSLQNAQQPAVYCDGYGNAMDVVTWTALQDPQKFSKSYYDVEVDQNNARSVIQIPASSSLGALTQKLQQLLKT